MTTILAIARCSTKRQADKLSIPFQLTEMANFVRREFGVDTEVKPLSSDTVPFYYTCDPKYDFLSGGDITDEDLYGNNYGYK